MLEIWRKTILGEIQIASQSKLNTIKKVFNIRWSGNGSTQNELISSYIHIPSNMYVVKCLEEEEEILF